MISIKNRKMLIPNEERYIGTTFDDNSEVRTFKISRYTQTDIDLSAFTAKADIFHCDTETTDRADLEMEVQAKYILLHLYITAGMVATPGTRLIDLKLFNDDGEVKWSSYKGAFYVEDPFATPQATQENLTELEQLEARINRAVATAGEKAAEVAGAWLEENIAEIEGYVIDKSLSIAGAAADAKTVGDRINNLNIGVLYPALSISASGSAGACQAMYNQAGHAVLVDMGIYSSYDLIRNALKSAGIHTIDHVILSHWHGDHHGAHYTSDYSIGYDHWKADFDMSNTVFWVPDIPSTYETSDNQYLLRSFPRNRIEKVKKNGVAFTWHDVEYSIYNASPEDFAYYDANSPDDYNAYSLIVYATCGNARICNTADINEVACKRAVSQGYALRSSLMTAPHHGVNTFDTQSFADAVSPKYVYVSNNTLGLQTGYQDGIFEAVLPYAQIFTNAENYPMPVTFVVNHQGISVAGSPSVVTPYGDSHIRTIYVDATVPDSQAQNGSAEHPYKHIRRAITAAKGLSRIVLLSDLNDTFGVVEANGYLIIDGNQHRIPSITVVRGGTIELKNLAFDVGFFFDARAYIVGCSTQQTITASRSVITLRNVSTDNDITLLNAIDSMVAVDNVLTKNRKADHPLFTFTRSYATGNFAFSEIGEAPNITCNFSYVNFDRLVEVTPALLQAVWDAEKPPLIVYDAGAGKYARITQNGLQYVQNEADTLKCKQVQFDLPASVSAEPNVKVTLLDSFDLSTVVSDLHELYSFQLDWATGSVTISTDAYVTDSKKAILVVIALQQTVISAVRLTVWYK